MLLDPSLFVKTLIENKITPSQHLFMMLCGVSEKENYKAFMMPAHKVKKKGIIYKETLVALHYRLIQELNPSKNALVPETYITQKEIQNLIERGFIKMSSGIDTIKLTDKGLNMIFGDYENTFEELWQIYPTEFWSDGKKYPAKTTQMGKDELENLYLSKIKFQESTHKRIIEILKESIENGFVNCGIEKFVKNELWNEWYNIIISE